MIISISKEGASALYELAKNLKENNGNIKDACYYLKTKVDGLGSTLGIYEEKLHELITEVENIQRKGGEAIEVLSVKSDKLASDIELIVNNIDNFGTAR